VKQITRRYSSKDASSSSSSKDASSSSSSKDASSSTFKQNHFFNFIEANGQVISVFTVAIGGAYFFGSQHVYHTVELKSVKESLIEKEKALEKILFEKEKVAVEKEKALEKVLFEKEKTQAAEKRELEARIRELETRIKFGRPPAS